MPVQNAEIAEMFDQAAELLEIKGDNPFRARAYRRAARVVETLPQSITGLLNAGQDLSELPGIGKDLAGKIAGIVKTGNFDLLTSLKRELPGEIGEIAALPGLGPKRVKLLVEKLGVRTIEELRRAAKAGRLHETRGLGAASRKKCSRPLQSPPRRSASGSRLQKPRRMPSPMHCVRRSARAMSWWPAATGDGATRSAISTFW